jgi:pSer/pThr/pTyr-binding forkhead associated (FHA) protein
VGPSWPHEEGGGRKVAGGRLRSAPGHRLRAHAEIVRSGDEFLVRDLGATNLTRVNDCIITRCALHNGDELRFARTRCVFVCAAATEASLAEDGEKPS